MIEVCRYSCIVKIVAEVDHFIESEWHMYEDEYGNTYYYNQQVSSRK